MEGLKDKTKRTINSNIDLELEEVDQNEIMDLLNLIEVNEIIPFEEAFKNQILSLIEKKKIKTYFNFKYQKNTPLLDYIVNYINASNFTKDKKKEDKKDNKGRLNNNETFDSLKGSSNNESLSSNYSFSFMNQGSKLGIPTKNNDNKENEPSDGKVNKNDVKGTKVSSLDDQKVFNNSIQQNIQNKSGNIKIRSYNFDGREKKYNENKNKSNTNDSKQETDMKNANKNEINDIDSKINKSKKLNQNGINQKDSLYIENILENDDKKNELVFLEDGSNLKGKSFENNNTINYLLEVLYCISKDKNYKIIADFKPNLVALNNIFKKNGLRDINKIQFDFLICNLLIEDLISLFIQIFPSIHFNSSVDFSKTNKKFLDINDLEGLKKEYKGKRERIDIMGEVGLNIFNEYEKCEQMAKYRKLIYNVNKLIEMNSQDLAYVLELLKFNPGNKKIVMFITNGKYEQFKYGMQREFLFFDAQKQFHINSILVFKSANSLYQISFISKIIKKYKKNLKNDFFTTLELKKDNIFDKLYDSGKFKSLVIKFDLIAKRIKDVKKELLNYLKHKNDFILLLDKFKGLFSSQFFIKLPTIIKNINNKDLRIKSEINIENIKYEYENTFVYIFYDNQYPKEMFKNDKSDKMKFLFYEISDLNINDIDNIEI